MLVTAPDRLARNDVHQMVLLEEWARFGCIAEFLDRPMSDDPHDHLLLQIRGAVAEYERTLIAERMRRGRLAKLRAGLLLPWTYPPYGYRLHPDRPRDPRGVTLEPAEAAVVAELFALYREPGTSLMDLARHLDARGVPTPSGKPCWSGPTIRGILCNPTYTGQVYAQRTRCRPPTHRRSATHPIGRSHDTAVPQPADTWIPVGPVPAVVSQAHFDEVQAKLATNRSFARRNNTAHPYLLRVLVSCGCCGMACTARVANGRTSYYLCTGKGRRSSASRAACCPARSIPADQLDEVVWNDLCALLREPEPLAAAVARAHGGAWLPQELLARRETLHRAQAHLGQQLERLTDAYLRAVIPLDEYERRRRDREQQIQALASQEELLRNDAARQQHLAGVAASLEAFRTRVQHGLAAATFEQRRQLVLLLIDRVVVTDADVEIRYVLPTSTESEHVRFCQLRKDYFHHPGNLGRDEHAVAASRDRLDGDAEVFAGLGQALAAIAEIANGWSLEAFPDELAQHRHDALGIVYIGRGGINRQREAIFLDRDMDLHPTDLLAAVDAPREAAWGRAAGPAVDHDGARLGRVAARHTPGPAQPVEQAAPQPKARPAGKQGEERAEGDARELADGAPLHAAKADAPDCHDRLAQRGSGEWRPGAGACRSRAVRRHGRQLGQHLVHERVHVGERVPRRRRGACGMNGSAHRLVPDGCWRQPQPYQTAPAAQPPSSAQSSIPVSIGWGMPAANSFSECGGPRRAPPPPRRAGRSAAAPWNAFQNC
ncbi:site-specific DNA recombinase [Azospirillum canadense]|nr:site-specific DNA recombinase [Azospirillum canadense]